METVDFDFLVMVAEGKKLDVVSANAHKNLAHLRSPFQPAKIDRSPIPPIHLSGQAARLTMTHREDSDKRSQDRSDMHVHDDGGSSSGPHAAEGKTDGIWKRIWNAVSTPSGSSSKSNTEGSASTTRELTTPLLQVQVGLQRQESADPAPCRDNTPYPQPVPPTWRETRNLDQCVGDEITMTSDPLYPSRMVYRRTISFEYQAGYRAMKLLVRSRLLPRPRAAGRVDISLCSQNQEWLRSLDKSVIVSSTTFVTRETSVM